jgi:predicted AlkP superfamily phosphohydrolase/phosphomutase
VLIGFDAADETMIRRLAGEGRLPTLAGLLDRGCTGVLRGEADRFAGAVWPTFYTGQPVGRHGLYHNKLWRQERMRCEIADASWFPERTFWERLHGRGRRSAIVDVPMTVSPPTPLDGISLSGWGTHDVIARGSWPPSLWEELAREHGKPRMPAERFGAQTPASLARLATDLGAATGQLAEIGAALYRREPWDLFLLVLGATHRGGHYLWDLSQVDTEGLAPERRRELDGALAGLYVAADAALGRLLASVPASARVMVFAVHGMGPNTAWADRCPDILARILSGGAEAPVPRTGLLYALKRRLPWPLARAVTTRLPLGLQARLVPLWSGRMFDWPTTRAFPLPMDHAGYVRVNLRGREPAGIVGAGPEYAALCDQIAAGFLGFRDAASGRPIVRRVHRLAELAGDADARRDRLPDLVVEWGDVPPGGARVIRSDRYGEIAWDSPRLPSGRAGNHRPDGWFVAVGPDIPRKAAAAAHPLVDLAPTVYRWLDLDPDPEFAGRPIPELAS